jgi:hypothetical protein
MADIGMADIYGLVVKDDLLIGKVLPVSPYLSY